MSSHAIERLRVHLIDLPAKAVHSHGSGDVGAIRSAILELVTTSGVVGWGEASPWPVFTGTVEAAAAALDRYLRPHLVGQDPVQIEPIMTMAERRLVGHPEAKAALETALLDIKGQIAGLPIAELVGGRHRSEIAMSFSVANPDFDEDLETVEELFADGVRLFKVKTGFRDHKFDLMRLERLRKRFGDDIDLRVDYNQGLTAFDALRQCRDLEAFRLSFIEQPVKMHERSVLANIAHALDTPLMADESVFNIKEAIAAANDRVADVFSLKIMKAGGIRRCLDVAAVAKAAGIGIYGGCMFETSIAHMAGTHLMAAVPDLELGCEFYMSTYYAKTDIAETPFPVKGGKVHLPSTPGLGTRPDLDKLEHYRTKLLE